MLDSNTMKLITNGYDVREKTNLTKNYVDEKLITDPNQSMKRELAMSDRKREMKGKNNSTDLDHEIGLS